MKTSRCAPPSDSAEFLDYVWNLCEQSVLGVVILSYDEIDRLWAIANTGDRLPNLTTRSHVNWVRTMVSYGRWRLRDEVLRALES